MLSDDYDARVLAKNNNVEPVSVHRLLFSMATAGVISDVEAADFADALAPPVAHRITPPKSCAPASLVALDNPDNAISPAGPLAEIHGPVNKHLAVPLT